MASYGVVLVGTDGSESSFLAVDRAAELAADQGAKLVIACAYRAPSALQQERERAALPEDVRHELEMSGLMTGAAPAEQLVEEARERARRSGATNVEPEIVQGDAVDVLIDLATRHDADLLVVGNRGLNRRAGRLLGSIPQNVAHRAPCDVLIVHTTG